MMKVGAVSLGWSGTPLPEVFAQLAEMGGECIEINGNTQRHHGVTLDSSTIPQVQKQAADAGLAIASISGYCDFAQTDVVTLDVEVERLMTSCRVASEMDVPVVRAFVGDVKPDITLDGVYGNFVTAFQKACEQAAALGVTLGIENHGRLINDGPALVKLVKDVDASNLGFTIDTGNFAWAGHNAAQVRADFEAVLPYIVNVHIKDGVWRDGGFPFVPAGEGELPLEWLLKQLAVRGYDGNVCSEFEGAGDFTEGTRRSVAYLKRVVSKLT